MCSVQCRPNQSVDVRPCFAPAAFFGGSLIYANAMVFTTPAYAPPSGWSAARNVVLRAVIFCHAGGRTYVMFTPSYHGYWKEEAQQKSNIKEAKPYTITISRAKPTTAKLRGRLGIFCTLSFTFRWLSLFREGSDFGLPISERS